MSCTGKDLEATILECKDRMNETGIKLEKADLILSELINEYCWNHNLDLRRGLMYASTVPHKDEGIDEIGMRTHMFVYDYKKIMQLINIAADYVYDAIRSVEDLS